MSHKLSADEARSWLADRMGKIVTATLTTGGRVETADTGRLREYDDGYRIAEIALLGLDDPTLSVEYELRWDDPDVDRLVAVVNGGLVEVSFRWEDEDAPPRVWGPCDFMKWRREHGDT